MQFITHCWAAKQSKITLFESMVFVFSCDPFYPGSISRQGKLIITMSVGNVMDNLVKPHRSAAGASFGGGGSILTGVWGGVPSTQTFYFITVPRYK